MINSIKTIIAISILFLGYSTLGNAQCKSQIKESITKLSPYKYNGVVNNAKLPVGKATEFHISVYKGLKYRFQIASDLNAVSFKIYDENKKEIFNNTQENVNSWDFISNSSQELIVEISAVDKAKEGCVGLVVGIQTPTKNSIRNL